MNRYVLSTLAALAVIVAFAMSGADVQADHGYGCGVPAAVGCAGAYADYGCAGRAGLFAERRPVRRLIAAPFRAVRALRIAPGRRFGGCG